MAAIAAVVIQLPVRPATALVVTFRDDHTVLAGGAPFFPIGIYGADRQRPDAALEELADFGFNTVATFGWSPGETADGPTRQWLDQVAGHGLKTWAQAHRGMAVPESGPEAAVVEQQLRAQVQQLRDHPSLLWWEVADEPGWNSVPIEDLRRGQAVVRNEDPGHPVALTEVAVPHLISAYADIGDVGGTWMYPDSYGGISTHNVAPAMEYLRTGRGDVPAYFVLSGWAWDPLRSDWPLNYPTADQTRFMAYQAVIHGAKGLFFYGQISASAPTPAYNLPAAYVTAPDAFQRTLEHNDWFWAQTKPVIRELNSSRRFFTLRDAGVDRRVSSAETTTVELLTKEGGQSLTVLAVNASDAAASPALQLPAGVRASEVTVEYEGRTIAVDANGRFRDDFAAMGTHVYTVTPTSAPTGPPATALVTSFTPTRLRQDFSGWVGSTLKVGPADLRVSALGRWVVAGNSGTHTVKLVDAATGTDVASAAVNTAGAPAGSFRYVDLAVPVNLRAGADYYLVSEETAGGDAWYDYDTRLVTTGAAAGTGAVYALPTSPTNWVSGGSPGNGYGPSSLLYGNDAGSPATTTTSSSIPTTSSTSTTTTSLPPTPTTATSSSITTTPTGPTGPSPTALVTSFTPTNIRRDFSGWVGSTFKVGRADLRVSALGRWVVAGNSGSHTVKLVDAATGTDVASAAVNTAGAPAGSFRYVDLAVPVTLRAGADYYLVSEETAVGDAWYDYDTRLVTTGAAAGTGAVYALPTSPTNWVSGGSPGNGYGPSSLLYASDAGSPATTTSSTTTSLSSTTTSSTTTSSTSSTTTALPSTTTTTAGPTGPSPTALVTSFTPTNVRRDFSGWVGSTFKVGPADLRVSSLGRWVVAGNSGTHTVKLVDAATGSDMASAAVNTAGAPAGSFRYVDLAVPVTLRAGAAYYLVSEETAGGDAWYDYDTRLVTTGAAAGTGAVYAFPTSPTNWVRGGGPGNGYGPSSLLYR